MPEVLSWFHLNTMPFTNLKVLSRWLRALPVHDESNALRSIVASLKVFNRASQPLGPERLKMLLRLDASGQRFEQIQTLEYLCGQHDENCRSNLWNDVFTYCWQLSEAYQQFIRLYLTDPAGCAYADQIPTIMTRAMRCYGNEAKWRYFRGQPMTASMWKRLHKLYRLSEAAGFHRKRVAVLNSDDFSTCADEYGRILMLSLLRHGPDDAPEIEFASQWLGYWSKNIKLETGFDGARHQYYVSLGDGAGPGLVSDGVSGDKLRFWSLQPLLAQIRADAADMARGKTPASISRLVERCSLDHSLLKMQRLITQWTGVEALPFATNFEDKEICVAIGEAALVAVLKTSVSAPWSGAKARLTQLSKPHADNFLSLTITLDETSIESLRMGELIALGGAGESCTLGVIRSIVPSIGGLINTRIEIWSNSPRPVSLVSAPTSDSPRTERALFLPCVDKRGLSSSLILMADSLPKERVFDMYDRDNSYRIRVTPTNEHGGKWTRVRFDVIERMHRGKARLVHST